jgi:hypothetical protein
MTLEQFWRESTTRSPTIGERDEDNLQTLLAVLLDPEDATDFAAAVSNRGILTAVAPNAYPGSLLPGGNVLPDGRFDPPMQDRAEQMHHQIRNIAEMGGMILASETDLDRTVREAKEILMRDPRHAEARREQEYEENHDLAKVMMPSGRIQIRKAADHKWYRKDQFIAWHGRVHGTYQWHQAEAWSNPLPGQEQIWGEYASTLLGWYDGPNATDDQRRKWDPAIIADARVIRQDACRWDYLGPIFRDTQEERIRWENGPIMLSPPTTPRFRIDHNVERIRADLRALNDAIQIRGPEPRPAAGDPRATAPPVGITDAVEERLLSRGLMMDPVTLGIYPTPIPNFVQDDSDNESIVTWDSAGTSALQPQHCHVCEQRRSHTIDTCKIRKRRTCGRRGCYIHNTCLF